MGAALDQHAAAGGAGLAGVLHDRIDDHRQRRIEVGIGEDDLRRLAAEFERDRHMVDARPPAPPRVPVCGEPVNEMWLMPGCAASAAPASMPRPQTMFSAPAGKPASSASAAMRSGVRQASSAGLTTQALPAARAPPTERPKICAG